jgi:voltage-gated potassium channel Kch
MATRPADLPGTASKLASRALVALVFVTVFLVPLLPPAWYRLTYVGLYTAIFVVAALSLEKYRRIIMGLAVIASMVQWIAHGLQMAILTAVSHALSGMFFLIVVLVLIMQIAAKKHVDARVILGAINGYLLLGLAASAAVAAIALYTPEAFSFSAETSGLAVAGTQLSDHIYYGFVTLTTVGYGDIVPQAPLAKSLAILIGVTGQLYVAINIAMLVGKFSSAKD